MSDFLYDHDHDDFGRIYEPPVKKGRLHYQPIAGKQDCTLNMGRNGVVVEHVSVNLAGGKYANIGAVTFSADEPNRIRIVALTAAAEEKLHARVKPEYKVRQAVLQDTTVPESLTVFRKVLEEGFDNTGKTNNGVVVTVPPAHTIEEKADPQAGSYTLVVEGINLGQAMYVLNKNGLCSMQQMFRANDVITPEARKADGLPDVHQNGKSDAPPR